MKRLQVIKLAQSGISIKELATVADAKEHAARMMLIRLEKEGMVEKKEGSYYTTPVGLGEIQQAVAQNGLPDIPPNLQLVPLQTIKRDKVEEIKQRLNQEQAVAALMEMGDNLVELVVACAIAMDDFTYLENLIVD